MSILISMCISQKELLGEEILLIGTEYLKRPENSTHRWHCDTKTVKCNTSAAVWVALANVTELTSLKVLNIYIIHVLANLLTNVLATCSSR